MNLMLINVSTRKLRRAVRLPDGDLPAITGDGTSKSAASRRFVALSTERLAEWMASDLSKLDLLVIQIDGLHIGNDLVLVAALGIDGEGKKHPLGLVEGATENAAVVQTLIDNLIERGLDPKVPRLFIIDGAKALSKVIRSTFGRHTPIQRCQIHKARNVIERLPKSLHASVRKALRQAWELDDADKAERLLRNLARRLEHGAPGVAASILEGIEDMLTVSRLGLPAALKRSLACTNSIENMMGTVRRVCRNVKRWQNAPMALRWTAAGMIEAAKGFRRLKAYKQLPLLRAALAAHQGHHVAFTDRTASRRRVSHRAVESCCGKPDRDPAADVTPHRRAPAWRARAGHNKRWNGGRQLRNWHALPAPDQLRARRGHASSQPAPARWDWSIHHPHAQSARAPRWDR